MSSENNDNEAKDQNSLNESESAYAKPRIRFFGSFEEQREEMYVYWASLTPVHLMENLHELIIKSFGLTPEKLANPKLYRKSKLPPPKAVA